MVRAADCRSAGPWFKSGCALILSHSVCVERAKDSLNGTLACTYDWTCLRACSAFTSMEIVYVRSIRTGMVQCSRLFACDKVFLKRFLFGALSLSLTSKYSATGTRTRVARVRAEYPNQLDYSGSCLSNSLGSVRSTLCDGVVAADLSAVRIAFLHSPSCVS